MREITSALRFPEGPIAMPDGSVILVEIERATLSRVSPDGKIDVIAETGPGPNGAAIGPDGKCYVCVNGGFKWYEKNGVLMTGLMSEDYPGGSIQTVDLETGAVETLYDACDGEPLKGPNDIVFDKSGGFWFTDHGKHAKRSQDRTGVFYARADGSHIEEVIFPLHGPNGIGLSPDEKTLYVAETPTARLLAFDLESPGKIVKGQGETNWMHGRLLAVRPDFTAFDSLAVDGEGNICVATLLKGGISIIHPETGAIKTLPMPDPMTTNICFGGEDLRTAYITLSSTGRLVEMEWETPGLALNFVG